MGEVRVHKEGLKRDWTLSASAFDRLLRWLGEDADSDGRRYLELRRRLVAYFDRKNCPAPDELADETLNRVARRLEEEDVDESEAPARYCYIVARFVFMEHLRGERKENALLENMRRQGRADGPAMSDASEEKDAEERALDYLERCVGELGPAEREIITRYYIGEERVKIENRRALARELGLTVNALSVRACRIRTRLEDCLRRCLGAG